jgi:hypothetical protein
VAQIDFRMTSTSKVENVRRGEKWELYESLPSDSMGWRRRWWRGRGEAEEGSVDKVIEKEYLSSSFHPPPQRKLPRGNCVGTSKD